ncbi:hypothetical protein K8B33_03290 [Alcanivorax sp. JB21]|uniref:hypothetical protein n=1 Tax=Alcanivorax limicola TaxID=2874102 RepID=UPI001CBF3986|nr:hypothetical protein [Alcanivorax limicola]MBZ2188106.1 hypothetical protein [Alcanivorax limicola]
MRHASSLSLALFALGQPLAFADSTDPGDDDEAPDNRLRTVTVIAGSKAPGDHEGDAGERRFDRRHIDAFGAADGGIEQLLKQVPAVQFGEAALEADAISDIRPESLSISGGRFFENQFALDGLSTSNRLDPANRDGLGINAIPGHEQGLFIDSSLIDEIRIFDSNAPVEYGGFTGGVVDLTTIRPGRTPAGNLGISGTHSDWAQYRIFTAPFDPDDGGLPQPPPDAPQFQRQRLNASYQRALTEATAGLISVHHSSSVTSDVSLGRMQDNTQENLNLLVKTSTALTPLALLDVTLTHAPYSQQLFLKNVRHSEIDVSGGGQALQTRLDILGDTVSHDIRLSLNHQENERRANNGFFNWQNTRSRDWGARANLDTSREGGYGDLSREQQGAELRWIIGLASRDVGALSLTSRIGTQLRYTHAMEQRRQRLLVHNEARTNSNIECRGEFVDCVPGEQYFVRRTVYDPDRVSVALVETALFTEQTLDWSDVSLRAGLRLEHDDFLDNLNLSPRATLSWDIAGRGATRLTLGANRYYGAPLLTYRLREAQQPFRTQVRGATSNVVNDWEEDLARGRDRFLFSDLRTPFSDELAVDLRQALWGGHLTLSLLARDNRDELARTETDVQADGFRNIIMNNEGRSRHRAASLGWEGAWQRLLANAYVTWSETRTNSNDYDSQPDPRSGQAFVFYNGRRLAYGELDILREDFARPLIANLALSTQLGQNLTLSLNTRYRASYRSIVSTGTQVEGDLIDVGGEQIPEQLELFRDERRRGTLLTDLGGQWQANAHWFVGAKVHNAFNGRTYTVPDEQSGVEIGRYFWLEAGLSF